MGNWKLAYLIFVSLIVKSASSQNQLKLLELLGKKNQLCWVHSPQLVRQCPKKNVHGHSCKVPLKASTPYRNIRKHGFFRLRLPRLQRVSLSWTWRRASVCAALPCSCRANLQPYHPSLASHAAASSLMQLCGFFSKKQQKTHWSSAENSMTAGLQSAISSAYIPAITGNRVPPQTNAEKYWWPVNTYITYSSSKCRGHHCHRLRS